MPLRSAWRRILRPALTLALALMPAALPALDPPPLRTRVTDLAGVLSADAVARLETKLREHEAQTSNQVAVLIVRSLEGDPIEDFSIRTVEAWQLGQAKKDNGILLLVAVDDRRMRIEVGQGLEGALPDVVASRIIRNQIAPLFRAGQYDAGVEAGVDSILQSIAGEYQYEGEHIGARGGLEGGESLGSLIVFPALAFLVWLLLRHLLWSRSEVSWPFFVPLNGAFSSLLAGPTLVSASEVLNIAGVFIAAAAFLLLTVYKVRWIRSGRPHPEAERAIVGGILEIGLHILLRGASRSGSGGGGWSGGGGGFSGGGGGFSGGGASGSW